MPLTILIAGAGIVGLSAAIPLATAGHSVHLFERSRFSTEVGAAFHFGPSAYRVLKRWGVDLQVLDPVVCEHWLHREWEEGGKKAGVKFHLREKQKQLGVTDDEIMVHRIDAHSALREHALRYPNVHLHLAAGVASVDTAAGSVTLQDGSVHVGDVVVGADGVHSVTVEAIVGKSCPTRKLGLNMYRFMVDTQAARRDPMVSALLDKLGTTNSQNTVYEPNGHRFLVVYPCRGGSLLNCATFQPAAGEKVPLTADWTNPGSVQDVLDLLVGWPEDYKRFIALGEDVKHWAVVARDLPHTFIKDKLVLIGDAAHPTHPSHGAGAGVGVEDAGVLGVLLDASVEPADVPARLALFNELRYERTATVKYMSEMVLPGTSETQQGMLRKFIPEGEIPLDAEAYMWPVDVMQEAKQALPR